MSDLADLLGHGPGRIGLTLGAEIDDALADPGRVTIWVPRQGTRLLLAGTARRFHVFSDTGGTRWQRLEATDALAGAGIPDVRVLTRPLRGVAIEAWLSPEPGALHPYDMLRYASEDILGRPLAERMTLLDQFLADTPRLPGRWFMATPITGPHALQAEAPDALRPLIRALAGPYPTASRPWGQSQPRLDWILALR